MKNIIFREIQVRMGLKPALAPCGRGFTGILYFSMIIAKNIRLFGNAPMAKKWGIKEIVQFETELLRKDPTKELLVAATLIMSNKILDKETFNKLWEEIKMIKAFEFAEEIGYDRGINEGMTKGYDKGKNDGINEGALKNAKMMLIEIIERNSRYRA